MEPRDFEAMLDKQGILVQALSEVCQEALEKKGFESPIYQKANRWYDQELDRYRKLRAEYNSMQISQECYQLRAHLAQKLTEYSTWPED